MNGKWFPKMSEGNMEMYSSKVKQLKQKCTSMVAWNLENRAVLVGAEFEFLVSFNFV